MSIAILVSNPTATRGGPTYGQYGREQMTWVGHPLS